MAYSRNNLNPANAMPVWIVAGGVPIPPGYTLVGYQQVTDLSAAVALTPPTGATLAVVQVNAGVVRYRRDGVAPTGTVGMLAYATGPAMVFDSPTSALKFIQNSGSTASLSIEWYGSP
jgi:hypothetical protein